MNFLYFKKAQIGVFAFLLILGIINFSFAQEKEELIRERIGLKERILKFWEEKIVPFFKNMVHWKKEAKNRIEKEFEQRKLIAKEELKKEKEELKEEIQNAKSNFEKVASFIKNTKEKVLKKIHSLINR